MKKYFLTGIVILLPLALTLAIVGFIVGLLTTPFLGLVEPVFAKYHYFEHGFLFFTGAQLQHYVAQVIILIGLVFVTLGLGAVTQWVLFHYLLRFGEYILHRIPFISSIYKTSQDVINTIFTPQSSAFKKVVLVNFPNPDMQCMGFITCDDLSGISNEENVAVFIPTTPNPTSGFLVMIKRKEIVHLEMKVEEALKYVISCGVILPSKQLTADNT